MIEGSRHANLDLFDRDVLAWDPFFGDETDVVVLSDRMVVTRKEHRCQHCCGHITVGERVRRRAEVNREDHQRMSFYFCAPCCDAAAKTTRGEDDDALDGRERLHDESAAG